MAASRVPRHTRSIFQLAADCPQWRTKQLASRISAQHHRPRLLHSTPRLAVVKPYLLADIGEGITECQIIQWFVQPGAKVAQFDKICEVQSDKAAVEITSRFDGIVKKLYYEADDMAKVGSPLVDIDIKGEIGEEDAKLTGDDVGGGKAPEPAPEEKVEEAAQSESDPKSEAGSAKKEETPLSPPPPKSSGKHASLATPAVRHLTKELNINIEDIEGTGKDGRVLKEDVQRFAAARDSPKAASKPATFSLPAIPLGEDKTVKLSGIQKKMYETMTKSLTIPHFLYSDTVDYTALSKLRKSINAQQQDEGNPKMSALPFIVKAVSLALARFPSLNAHLDTSDASAPTFIHKASHNIGFAVDTPQGLIVPVVKNVQSHSITSLAAELARLGELARNNKLSAADLKDATFTVSNIGAVGGLTVAPVIVSPQVAIVGIGKTRAVPAFAADGSVVRREETVFSWSADHRVIDGATAARCAALVKKYLENVEQMLVQLR